MSATPQNNDNQEIDLSLVSKKIGGFFENISTQIFKGFLFFKRNSIWVGILFVLGAGLGFYLDRTSKAYDNQVIVMPNFGSTDYLYAKIDLINSKIEEGDTVFLKKVVQIKEPKTIKKIEIKPITDVYKFIDNKAQNFELIKLMAEDGDIKKIVEESLTSKNYPFHSITFVTDKKISNENTVSPLLNYLNDSEYFAKVQKEYLNNIKVKMVENDSIIAQINGFLNTFNGTLNGSQKSDKLVYYNENSQLDEVIKTKDNLITEQGNHRLELINLDKIVKENSTALNIRNNKAINGKMKLILPVLFIGLFVLVGLLKSFYQYQMAKLNS
ncbi:hypothetical protein IVB69_08195 [Flavobacterium sp. J49]|uniref:hypothetical protein n=1 Tax=Flavobacterium sp. J49 TaxID=2718534 RepID=UPI0015947EE5|nr:hypothetical protein [Flavobacterium sp. J49]MBF6641458.1 hypothetical protein [Flavobacterium sp. J49]NIC02705.1 hypothetical protein [Flavobacterium sp. J49]